MPNAGELNLAVALPQPTAKEFTMKIIDSSKQTQKQDRRLRAIAKRRLEIMPLSDFSQEHQDRIAEQVAAPKPPERWILLGDPNCGQPTGAIPSRAWYEWHWERGINPTESNRDSMPRRTREAVIARDGHVCQICMSAVEPTDIHIDHIKPYSKGGQTLLINLQVTHSLCNMQKGARY